MALTTQPYGSPIVGNLNRGLQRTPEMMAQWNALTPQQQQDILAQNQAAMAPDQARTLQVQPGYQTLGGMAQQPQQGGSGDPFADKIRQSVIASYGGAQPDPAFVEDQVKYFLGKRGSGETSGWATGEPGKTMDDYWIMRAGQAASPQSSQGGFGSQGGFSDQAQNGVASFSAPGLLAPYTKEFQPTDINTILQAPAFQAAQANGIDQIQRGAAAKGTLLTGGTLKDLSQWNQGLALGELNNQFNRDLSTYGTNRDTFTGNQNNAFNKLSQFANTGGNIASNLGNYGTGYANNAQQNATNQGGLYTNQGDTSASLGLTNAQNTNNTLGGLAKNAFDVIDWSKLFKRGPNASLPTNTGGSPTGGAALPMQTA